MERTGSILITGSSHGIGRATAEWFLDKGWEVFGCGSSPADLRGEEMARQHSGFHFRRADISEESEVRGLLEWCGSIDAAFNNAGIGCEPKSMHLLDALEARRILEVNLLGTAFCMKYECMAMQAEGGVIVNSSSVAAAKAGTGADWIYSASKAGILRMTAEAAVRREYWDKIRFFSLIPGWIETRMTAADDKEEWKKKLPSGKAGTPQEAARLVYRIVTEREAFDSGQEFHVNGGGSLL
jgi:3-oxoacyl-[acyl-carrier protein] reductase